MIITSLARHEGNQRETERGEGIRREARERKWGEGEGMGHGKREEMGK